MGLVLGLGVDRLVRHLILSVRLANLFVVYTCRLVHLAFGHVCLLVNGFAHFQQALTRFGLGVLVIGR